MIQPKMPEWGFKAGDVLLIVYGEHEDTMLGRCTRDVSSMSRHVLVDLDPIAMDGDLHNLAMDGDLHNRDTLWMFRNADVWVRRVLTLYRDGTGRLVYRQTPIVWERVPVEDYPLYAGYNWIHGERYQALLQEM